MKQLLLEKVILQEVLPYSIYNKEGTLVFSKGETLTQDKIRVLSSLDGIYTKIESKSNKVKKTTKKMSEQKVETQKNKKTKSFNNSIVIENFDFIHPEEKQELSHIDSVDVKNYKGPTNKKSKIAVTTQIRIKTVFIKALELFQNGEIKKSLELFTEVRNKIKEEVLSLSEKLNKCSELMFLGEYTNCHALNTATLVAHLAIKLGYKEDSLNDAIMAALLHDLGKIRMTKANNHKDHIAISCDIIKNEFKLNENVLIPVFEHHERNDGAGYPKGLSGEHINIFANMIMLCSTFDNLMFNRTNIRITNSREALREILNIGTSHFLPEIFYKFIYMFSYNDSVPLEEMALE